MPSLLCGKAATLLQEGGSGHCQRNSLVPHAWIMSWGAPDPGAGARVALLFALVPSAHHSPDELPHGITMHPDVFMTHTALIGRKLPVLTSLPTPPPHFFFFSSLSTHGLPASDLKVTNVDFLKSQNSAQHHTDAYETTSLVVRRGQAFLLQLTLSRELRASDKLALHFSIGKPGTKQESPGHLSPLCPCKPM